MSRIAFVTQLIDPEDPVLGAVPAMVRALADRAEGVDVIANEVRSSAEIRGNVTLHSLKKEAGAGRGEKAFRYGTLIARTHADVVFAHMCPSYLTAAWPVAKARKIKTILWFAHPRISRSLVVAERLSDSVVTSLPGAYPRPSSKVRAIGQAIDMEAFPHSRLPERRDGVIKLLALGRTSDSKRYELTIDGIALARAQGIDARLRIVGPVTTPHERAIAGSLRTVINELGLDEAIELVPGVPHRDVPDLIADCDALINTTIPGSADKAVFEAMASGRPAFVTNPAFADLVAGLDVRFEDAHGFSRLLERFASMSPSEREELGDDVHDRVQKEHSLDHWADSVMDEVEGLVR